MSKPNYSAAIADALFVLLPFLLLVVVKIMKGISEEIIMMPDYSLAISIMYGQLLSKTLYVNENRRKNDNFQLFQVIIFVISMIAIVFYTGFQLITNVPKYIYILQFILFIIALVIYIPTLTLINKMSLK
ncbi:hypothetical protein MJO48_05200 [Dickeya fangzhongdai]|uniref:hypothetical protein n=1 Tax=Pectobacteriaceae TaxID=1903410 RepID=UPI000EA12A09|nr:MULTISPECIES: hypothetical protein [Pectobacteriaceae]MDE8754603.1 hypothetical protein [Pectobacterium polaris]RJL20967.1 hypothetical protein D5074_15230 [Pectobacterium polaris]ULR32093.1 hypothetical protein MJO48_05200 [Dickeya fangzhongdai]